MKASSGLASNSTTLEAGFISPNLPDPNNVPVRATQDGEGTSQQSANTSSTHRQAFRTSSPSNSGQTQVRAEMEMAADVLILATPKTVNTFCLSKIRLDFFKSKFRWLGHNLCHT